tara:strand:- start:352 stop:528 length:177 start_codon:yes stop_codon:yes gene_type:complete
MTFNISETIALVILVAVSIGGWAAIVAHLYTSKKDAEKSFDDFIGEITIEELNEGEKR